MCTVVTFYVDVVVHVFRPKYLEIEPKVLRFVFEQTFHGIAVTKLQIVAEAIKVTDELWGNNKRYADFSASNTWGRNAAPALGYCVAQKRVVVAQINVHFAQTEVHLAQGKVHFRTNKCWFSQRTVHTHREKFFWCWEKFIAPRKNFSISILRGDEFSLHREKLKLCEGELR